jgi:hypothetical protein
MAYGCRVPIFGREREHHILVVAPTSSLGVGHHRHVQLGVRCTSLVVPCAMRRVLQERCERQPQRLRIPPTGLDVGAFPSRWVVPS